MATAIYVGGAALPARSGWGWLSAGSILLAAVALYQQQAVEAVQRALVAGGLSGPLLIDHFSLSLRWGVLAVALVFVILAARWSEQGESSEFMGSLLLIVAGLMLLSMA